MFKTTALFLFSLLSVLNYRGADETVPFTHDFDTGLHDWLYWLRYWAYTGQSNAHNLTLVPNLTHVPNFNNDGNYVWTQRSISGYDSKMFLTSDIISDVSETTKFYFRYWFSTQDTDGSGMSFNVVDISSRETFPPKINVSTSSDEWRDAMIDCQNHTCCLDVTPCDVRLKVTGTVGGPDGDAMGLAAIRCVSTEENGCDYEPHSSTTGVPTTSHEDPATTPPPGGSPFGSTPNRLAIVLLALLSLTLF